MCSGLGGDNPPSEPHAHTCMVLQRAHAMHGRIHDRAVMLMANSVQSYVAEHPGCMLAGCHS
jgi:hypothetical protein